MSTVSVPAAAKTGWLTKVPAITATFWVIKILSTTIGETFADYLAVDVGLGLAVTTLVMFGVLSTALFVQFRTRRYTPAVYWLCVVLVSIVGTQITDFFTDVLGISLYVSTVAFAALLSVVFVVWYRQERTLAITSINTPRREAFYWGAILVTFALGTAAGDLATEALSLGFRGGVMIFGGLIAITYLAFRLGMHAVLAFWIAYVLTRPLGASLGDLLTQDRSLGGLGLGASITSLVFFAVIFILVVREQVLVMRHGVAEKGQGPHGGRRRDYAWAGAGLALVAIAGLSLGLTTSGAAQGPTLAGPAASRGSVAVRPTTQLGDVSSFTTIVSDVQTKITAQDLSGAKTKVKDLEIAWDSAESGLKPRDTANWHVLDGQIDTLLTSLRATPPSQADCAAAAKELLATLNKFNGI